LNWAEMGSSVSPCLQLKENRAPALAALRSANNLLAAEQHRAIGRSKIRVWHTSLATS
jgi:hypothetical protein